MSSVVITLNSKGRLGLFNAHAELGQGPCRIYIYIYKYIYIYIFLNQKKKN
jgi:hypothetical protein